jgi:6-phosphogluconolactonase
MGRTGLRSGGMESLKMGGIHDVIVHADLEVLSLSVAQRIEQLAAQAIKDRGTFRVALAGGETPRRCYELLRELPIDWRQVWVYFSDERCLPRGDAQRNDSMAQHALLGHIAIPPGNVHAMPAEHGARIAAVEYAALLEHELPLDLVLLGLGEDGHTASLFPGNPATQLNEVVVPVFDAPKPPPERVSLGVGTLNSARAKVFLVAGKAKQEALEKIMHGIQLPAARVAGAEWHVDRAALPEGIFAQD